MKFTPALGPALGPVLGAVTVAAAAAGLGIAAAPSASADPAVRYFGQPGELVNGAVVQHWTVTDLKPSSDVIPYQPVGRLWEATATDEAISGTVTPIVSNLNARAANGDTYRVLFGVATPQGVNPATLPQGGRTTGKIYFDVTGHDPDSVFYTAGGPDALLWLTPPPAPATGSSGRSSGTGSGAPSRTPGTAGVAETPPPPAPEAAPASVTQEPAATPAGSSGTPLPEGSAGTPLPEGSAGTPLPEGSAGTPLPDAAVPAETGPAPVPAAVTPAPQGSSGTPLPQDAQPAPAAPTTTVAVPVPPS